MSEHPSVYFKSSLLDRLSGNGNQEGNNGSQSDDGGVKEDIFRDKILRDIEWLFNAVSPLGLADEEMRRKYPHAANSVLGYGLRGVLGTIVTNSHDLEKYVARALKAFEPRLEVEDLSLVITQEGQLVEIEIKGFLLSQQARRQLWIRTDLATLNSKLRTQANG